MSKLSQLRKKLKKSTWLYEFTVKDLQQSEETEESVNEKGEKVAVTRTINKIVPITVKIKRPSRKMYDKAELYYGVKLSEGIKAGLLTKALLAKRYEDDGGSMSEREKGEYFESYYALLEKENTYQRLQLNLDNLDPGVKDKQMMDVLYEILDLRRDLREIEEQQSSLFNQTAENRAKNQVLMWWVLQLGFVGDEALFTGSMDEREDQYEVIEETGDIFLEEVIKKLAYFISFWYSGQAEEKADFDRAAEIYTSTNDNTEIQEALEEEEDLLNKEIEKAQEQEIDASTKEIKELKKDIEEIEDHKTKEKDEVFEETAKNKVLEVANAVQEHKVQEEVVETVEETVEEIVDEDVATGNAADRVKKLRKRKSRKKSAKKTAKSDKPIRYPKKGSIEEAEMKRNKPTEEEARASVAKIQAGIEKTAKEKEADSRGAKLPPNE